MPQSCAPKTTMLLFRMCAKHHLLSLLFLVFLMQPGVHAQAPELILLTEHNPPAAYLEDHTGRISGLAVDVVEELLKKSDIRYSMALLPWNRAYRRAITEPNVCVFPANVTPEREKIFKWVKPILTGGWAIFQTPDSDLVLNDLADLRKHSVIGKLDSTATEILEDELGEPIARAVDDVAAAKLLFGGRVDFWLSGRTSVLEAVRVAGVPMPKIALDWKPAELGVACHPDTTPVLLEALQTANTERLKQITSAP